MKNKGEEREKRMEILKEEERLVEEGQYTSRSFEHGKLETLCVCWSISVPLTK